MRELWTEERNLTPPGDCVKTSGRNRKQGSFGFKIKQHEGEQNKTSQSVLGKFRIFFKDI